MQTELWAARIQRELTAREQETMLTLLPPERCMRLLRVRDLSKQREVLCAWTLLRLGLWQALGWESLPEVSLTERGKPWFPAWPQVHFSLSHTAGAVLVGVSGGPIGVDIERIRPVSPRVMGRIAGAENEETFFQRWVALEAVGKRGGQGILSMLEEGALWRDPCYREVRLFPGYQAGAAVSPGFTVPQAKIYQV